MKTLAYPLLLLVPICAASCGGDSTDEAPVDPIASGASGASGQPELPERYWLASAPADARDVGAARADLTDGATVTVRGVIGGSKRPFVEGLAAFTLVDPALESCVGEGGACKTPWDYCCVDPQTISENSATVEFRDGDTLLETSLRGMNGLEPLATVVVQGVAERDPQGNVTIVSSGVRVLD